MNLKNASYNFTDLNAFFISPTILEAVKSINMYHWPVYGFPELGADFYCLGFYVCVLTRVIASLSFLFLLLNYIFWFSFDLRILTLLCYMFCFQMASCCGLLHLIAFHNFHLRMFQIAAILSLFTNTKWYSTSYDSINIAADVTCMVFLLKQLLSLATPPTAGDPETEPRMFPSKSVAQNTADKAQKAAASLCYKITATRRVTPCDEVAVGFSQGWRNHTVGWRTVCNRESDRGSSSFGWSDTEIKKHKL